jgi:ABC-type arginine transport system ATPase subunit
MNTYRNKLEQLKGRKKTIEDTISENKNKLRREKRQNSNYDKALQIVKEVGLKTQQQLSHNISDLVTMALESVFTEEPYKFKVDFIERRDKTECDLLFERNDNLIKPLDASGYGAVDVASFALRIVSWSMKTPHSRNVLILDEPFKHLKGEEANKQMLKMVKEISTKLGIQIIMVSDERVDRDITNKIADRVFEVKKKKDVSEVNII